MKFFSLFTVLFFALNSYAAESLDIVKVSFAKNVVTVDADTKIKQGDLLSVGTLVEGKAADSVLQVEWNDNKVVLRGKFKIKIDTVSEAGEPTLLNLVYGNLRALILNDAGKNKTAKRNFKVKTPGAVAGVRGTDFMVTYGELLGETEVICFESQIDFQDVKANKKPTLVKQGQWGGSGGRFGEIKRPIDLPANVLKHFSESLKFQ